MTNELLEEGTQDLFIMASYQGGDDIRLLGKIYCKKRKICKCYYMIENEKKDHNLREKGTRKYRGIYNQASLASILKRQKYQPLPNGKIQIQKIPSWIIKIILIIVFIDDETEKTKASGVPSNPLDEIKVRVKRPDTRVEEVSLGRKIFLIA